MHPQCLNALSLLQPCCVIYLFLAAGIVKSCGGHVENVFSNNCCIAYINYGIKILHTV